jgi:23S rRNA (adenine2503-C2)-methyltransferase
VKQDSDNSLSQPRAPAPANPSAEPLHLLGVSLPELRTWLTRRGQPGYRADQLADWIFAKGAESFEQMTNLGKALRADLAQHAVICHSTVAQHAHSEDGTHKLLLTYPDGAAIETVWIPDADRHTACLSSQVGCPVGCRFCASGLGGVQRNLTPGEIVEQALRVRQLIRSSLADNQARLTNIVMMGMGEPLANYHAVLAALRIITAPSGLGIGARRITISTVGLPAQIRRLAGENLPVNLALSLHAPDDELRRQLVPWGRISIADLLDACEHYFRSTGREITLEYVLLDGVNNEPAHARRLAPLARRLRANVNLLRYNPVPGLPFRRPNAEQTYEFQRLLRELGVNAHVRSSRGSDIAAACGQLRRAAAEAP